MHWVLFRGNDRSDLVDLRDVGGDSNLELENTEGDAKSTRVDAVVSESDRGGGVTWVLGEFIFALACLIEASGLEIRLELEDGEYT